MKAMKRADEILAKVLKWFVILLCIGIALILFVRVIVRFTPLLIPLSWSDEVVEWMMAWMIFTTATLIFRDSDHFRVDLLQTKFRRKAWVNVLNLAISIMGIAFFAALLYYSTRLVITATQFSPILKVSTRLPYASIPVNCVLILMYLVRDIVSEIKSLIERRHPLPTDTYGASTR
jgi:TRAP-type C4-dicarboxylate transport system permease small subunit